MHVQYVTGVQSSVIIHSNNCYHSEYLITDNLFYTHLAHFSVVICKYIPILVYRRDAKKKTVTTDLLKFEVNLTVEWGDPIQNSRSVSKSENGKDKINAKHI